MHIFDLWLRHRPRTPLYPQQSTKLFFFSPLWNLCVEPKVVFIFHSSFFFFHLSLLFLFEEILVSFFYFSVEGIPEGTWLCSPVLYFLAHITVQIFCSQSFFFSLPLRRSIVDQWEHAPKSERKKKKWNNKSYRFRHRDVILITGSASTNRKQKGKKKINDVCIL